MTERPSGTGRMSGPALRRRRLVTAACLTAQFMSAVEGTIVATAMPTIVGDLGGFALFSWVFAAYLLTQAVTTPIYGRLADVYGRKRIFFAGASVFLASSAACGFASGMVPLIVFRALQGVGAGAVQPIAWTIMGDLYAGGERARVQAAMSSIWGVSAIAGPVLGALIVEHLPWSLIFWINLPVGVAAMALLALFLDERVERRAHRIDYPGAALLMLGIGAIMLALVQAETLGRTAIAVLAAAGTAALAALAWQERRAAEPIMPFKLWTSRIIAVGNSGGFLIGALMIANTAFTPTYVQGAMGRSPTVAGLVLGASSVAWTFGSFGAGRLMVRTSYRTAGLAGAILLIAGALILVALTPARGPLWAAAGVGTIGLGMGFSNTTFLVSVQSSVGWGERGVVTSANMFLRTIGQSLGAALFGALLNIGVAREMPNAGDAVNRLLAPGMRGTESAGALAELGGAIARSLHEVYVIAALVAVVVLALTLRLPAGLSPTRTVPPSGKADAAAAD